MGLKAIPELKLFPAPTAARQAQAPEPPDAQRTSTISLMEGKREDWSWKYPKGALLRLPQIWNGLPSGQPAPALEHGWIADVNLLRSIQVSFPRGCADGEVATATDGVDRAVTVLAMCETKASRGRHRGASRSNWWFYVSNASANLRRSFSKPVYLTAKLVGSRKNGPLFRCSLVPTSVC